MSFHPTISVLMTAYNRDAYIASAIESVLAQTMGDWELVIVDDGSTDGTQEIARKYAAGDDRIRFIQNEHNLGDYPNRNHAAQFARGEYLKYHDSDDLLYPHCLEVMHSMLESEPRASLAASSGWSFPGGPCPMVLTPQMCYQREYLGNGLFNLGPAAFLFRREAFQRIGRFPEVGVSSDYAFWLRMAQTENVLLLPADLFWYRIHDGQELQSSTAANQYAIVSGLVWQALNSPECPLVDDQREQAKRNWAYVTARKICRDLRSGRWGAAQVRLRHCGLKIGDWLRYLRRQRRDSMAGTPRDDRGEFLDPPWLGQSAKPNIQTLKSA